MAFGYILTSMPKVIDPKPAQNRVRVLRGHRIGYVRVSTLEQNEARQLEGVDIERVFTDKASGKDIKRPQLEALLEFVREGDTVVCHSMDRMARNLDDLRRIVLGLTQRGVHVQFIKESLTFTGEDSPMANLLLSVMGAFAQFERELIKERQREGIAIAKKAGVYRGRKPSLTIAQADELRRRVLAGEKRTALARAFGISRDTVYEYAPVISAAERVPEMVRKTILCVEMNEQVLSVRRFMLETRGYAVKTARSDEEGREVLMLGGIDLVLSSTAGIVAAVKTMGLLLPTVYLAEGTIPEGIETGATLIKGSQSPVDILSAVRTLMHRYKLERQKASA